MNDTTLQRRTKQLYGEVNVHPYREELLDIMYQQQLDDVDPCSKEDDR